ncbi:MFS transporter [Plastoroseomonas hellenica]|uniref:MFS transporter n=1 Tax=Plastoroseomonas hellenica TaxID=2687306 RepID=A0ABS5F9Y9_9PROT|nr:MFS transporter [Plastoroseomonas hellenica]MBR0647966.1 MFS transporter [Plastoroseomonas hellenica]MBR0669377.1 MFS transporter [Plastoroseomonas hellenica]
MTGRSGRGLDWLNFFMANVQTGFGPFVSVYLTAKAWTELEIGIALSIGTLVTIAMQVPAGAMVDATPNKRLAAALALAAIAFSALLLAAWPVTLPVMASEVLHGLASCVLGPSIAAISLALVGQRGLGERLGRNARYAAVGSGVAAGLLGAAGTWLSGASVFWLTAALCLPSVIALAAIRPADLHPPAAATEVREQGVTRGLGILLRSRVVVVFALCCTLFTLSNAAMLPLAGTQVTRNAGDEANLIIAGCIIAPQLVMALIAPWIGRLAERRGRRAALLIGFAALPARGALLAVVEDPAWLILVQALDGISAAGLGVMLPLLAADATRGSNRFNLCLGVFGLAIGVGSTLSTTLAGLVAEWFGVGTAFALLAATGLLSVVAVWAAMPETRREPDPAPA